MLPESTVNLTHPEVERQSDSTGQVRRFHLHPQYSCHKSGRSPQRNAQCQFAIFYYSNQRIYPHHVQLVYFLSILISLPESCPIQLAIPVRIM